MKRSSSKRHAQQVAITGRATLVEEQPPTKMVMMPENNRLQNGLEAAEKTADCYWMTSLAILARQEAHDETGGIMLHLIRIVAIYLYVVLSQHPMLVTECLSKSTDRSTTANLEGDIHATVLAGVQNEIASNQFDGLLQEKQIFQAMKQLFRRQKVKTAVQCQSLFALLSAYLTLLPSAIVQCGPPDMVTSTLEYLVNESKPTYSLSMLYPLVSAIDSLSIEQRECLDALTLLWKWLSTCEASELLVSKLVNRHHEKIICFNNSDPLVASELPTHSNAELGICFIKTLLLHSNHLFRRDPEFVDPQLLLESDTEDEDSSEDGPTKLPQLKMQEPEICKAPTPIQQSKQEGKESLVAAVTNKVTKSAAQALRRRKKREKIVMMAAAATIPSAKQISSATVITATLLEETERSVDSPKADEKHSLPTTVYVGIAAFAGTVAAALCVIFT